MTGPLAGPLNAEDALNQLLVVPRGGAWDTITMVWSFLGSTEMVAAVCLVVSIVVLWHTRDWRLAAVPAMAVVLQLSIYLAVTALVPRQRPMVERLDTLLPMSSYPSGHVGAATALYLAFILLASRIPSVRRRTAVIVLCIAVPVLVALGRFLRGMHHASDVAVGALVGAGCAMLAYGWYRRASTRAASERRVAEPTSLDDAELDQKG